MTRGPSRIEFGVDIDAKGVFLRLIHNAEDVLEIDLDAEGVIEID